MSLEPISNTSPLRYPGGKTRARKTLLELLRSRFQTDQFTEVLSPFFGGGSFEFYLQEVLGYSVAANDKFTPLIGFWKAAKERNADLVSALRAVEVDKATFLQFREEVVAETDLVEQAKKLFVINKKYSRKYNKRR